MSLAERTAAGRVAADPPDGPLRRGRARLLALRKYPFPWRAGIRFELLKDGREFFPRMLEEIERARRHILLEIYLFESGAVAARFIDGFTRAAARGVTVKLLLDDFGALKLAARDRARLAQSGVELLFYNPLQYRKLLGNMF